MATLVCIVALCGATVSVRHQHHNGVERQHSQWETPLVVIDENLTDPRYCDEIIWAHILQGQRNARPHTAHVRDLLAHQNINVLLWSVSHLIFHPSNTYQMSFMSSA